MEFVKACRRVLLQPVLYLAFRLIKYRPTFAVDLIKFSKDEDTIRLVEKFIRDGVAEILLHEDLGEELTRLVVSFNSSKTWAVLCEKDPSLVDRQKTWSQEGEDLNIRRLLGENTSGIYVDIGAHHPYRFSNTYLLYQSGWSGINIDANPESIEKFRLARPRDINIVALVGQEGKELDYFEYDEPALNSASAELVAERRINQTTYTVISSRRIVSKSLASILDEYLDEGSVIDLLNLDVEGSELSVLVGNDWTKFSPRIILVEIPTRDILACISHPVSQYLAQLGYVANAKFYNTVIFVNSSDPLGYGK